jgi:hypothetical protein
MPDLKFYRITTVGQLRYFIEPFTDDCPVVIEPFNSRDEPHPEDTVLTVAYDAEGVRWGKSARIVFK